MISKLTFKYLFLNKRRTITTIVAIILTSILLFSVGFIYGTLIKTERSQIENSSHDYDVTFTNVPYDKKEILEQSKDVLKYTYISKIYDTSLLAYQSSKGDTFYEIYSMSDGISFDLVKGRLPKKEDELLAPSSSDFKLNEIINVDIKEKIKPYKIVGIYNATTFDSSKMLYTKDNVVGDYINFNIYLKSKNNAYKKIDSIASFLEISADNIHTNDTLLELYGNYKDTTRKQIIFLSLIIILLIISISCATIIYNSFNISINERKKQIGILKSVGMTPIQIRKLILIESVLLSLISIPIGFIISSFFTHFIVNTINSIQNGVRIYELGIYHDHLVICLIFILFTVLYSSFFPAFNTSKILPIELIRQNKEIKIKRKKLKFPHLFGIYGFISRINMKRNKRKYKVSLISSIVSFVLFITMMTFMNSVYKEYHHQNYETGIILFNDDGKLLEDDIVTKLTNLEEVTNYTNISTKSVNLKIDAKMNEEYQQNKFPHNDEMITIIKLDDEIYNSFIKEMSFVNIDSISVNNTEKYVPIFSHMVVELNNTKYRVKLINQKMDILKNNYFNNSLIVNANIYNSIESDNEDNLFFLLADDYINIDKKIKEIIKDKNITYHNVGLETMSMINDMRCLQIIIYTLIVLFAFISITSIINTISSSMSLRQREFAVLKSVGSSNKELNKLFCYEGLQLFIKTVIYGSIISIIIIFIIAKTLSLGINKYSFITIFPVKDYIITITVTFIVINIIIFISGKKYKQNIIETITKENV